MTARKDLFPVSFTRRRLSGFPRTSFDSCCLVSNSTSPHPPRVINLFCTSLSFQKSEWFNFWKTNECETGIIHEETMVLCMFYVNINIILLRFLRADGAKAVLNICGEETAPCTALHPPTHSHSANSQSSLSRWLQTSFSDTAIFAGSRNPTIGNWFMKKERKAKRSL